MKIRNKIMTAVIASMIAVPSVFATTDTVKVSTKDNVTYKYSTADDKINLGDEICFDSECFYVLNSSDQTTSLLAKYNLVVNSRNMVVSSNTSEGEDHSIVVENSNGMEVSYLQDSRYLGGVPGNGYVKKEELTGQTYLDSYKTKLTEIGITPIEVRIPDANDVHEYGCDVENECNDEVTPEWAHSTNYWILRGQTITSISKTKSETADTYISGTADVYPGLRPVVEVNTSDLGIVKLNVVDSENGVEYLNRNEDGSVTVNAEPDEGYEVDSVTAKDSDGNNVSVTKKDGKYVIEKANIKDDITITVTYKKTGTNASVKNLTEENPETLDNIKLMVALFSMSMIGLAATLYLKRRSN